MTQRLTIQDIARLAGVSTATVSRALNGRPDVDAATRARILGIVAEVGYTPTSAAVILSTGARRHHAAPPAFPRHFLWGVATSAFQIEGALQVDGRGPSIWDQFVATPPPDFTPQTAAVACDHYHQMPDDVALMAGLGITAYRFSLAWPRIMPDGEGRLNAKGLDFYDRLVDALLAAGVTPQATLYHWDLPTALQDRYGGWLSRHTAHAFADYAGQVARRLGDRVPYWMTLNEPWSVTIQGYVLGRHPPFQQDNAQALQVAHHLLLAHGWATQRLRQELGAGARIGVALNLTPIYPADPRPATQQAVRQADLWHNRWFLDPLFTGRYPDEIERQLAPLAVVEASDLDTIATPLDFLGVNYYSRAVVRPADAETPGAGPLTGYAQVTPVPEASYSQMGWETYATGLYDILLRVHHDYHPLALLVTENGVAYTDPDMVSGQPIRDSRRIAFLQEHIAAMQSAYQAGVPIQGYSAWTLFDNFEWTDGYSRRFGLIAVDQATQRRSLKESGRWYANFIATQRE